MKRSLLIIFVLLFGIGCFESVYAKSQIDILQHWAPEVYQDINSSNSGWWSGNRQYYSTRDTIVAIDFDKDWQTGNNWNNSHYQTWEQGTLSDRVTPPLYATSYVSFVESNKFYFLGYGYYHTGDDSNIGLDRHENDWEMVMLIIKKSGSDYGEFKGMLTQFHNQHKEYNITSDLLWNNSHPKIYISANGTFDPVSPSKHGHGIEAFSNSGYQGDIGEDAIIYQVADYGDNVLNVNCSSWTNAQKYKYKLISINELWNRRNNSDTYKHYTTFQGGVDDIDDSGNPPWKREYFYDPLSDFANRETFADLSEDLNHDTYIFNPYYGNLVTQQDNINPSEILNTNYILNEADIGSGSGKIYYDKDTYLIDGKGDSIASNLDNCYFLYKQLIGNGEIIVRLNSLQRITDKSQAGIMIRNSLSSAAKFVSLVSNSNMELSFLYRDTPENGSVNKSNNYSPTDNRPVFLKLKREYNIFCCYYSLDGLNYKYIGDKKIYMNNSVYIGIVVNSNDPSNFASATVDKVSIINN